MALMHRKNIEKYSAYPNINKEIMLKVSGSRAKTTMMKGIVNEVYSNIFTVLVDGVNKSFTYADVAIGDVCIYHM